MPLPDQLSLLCIAIEEKARKEADHIIETAHRQANDILDSAREDMKRQLEDRLYREREAANREASRITDAAGLKARQFILKEKKALLAMVMEDARRKLDHIRKSPEYPAILTGLVRQAVSEMPGTSCIIQVNREDRTLLDTKTLKALSQDTGRDSLTLMDTEAAIQGGCLAYSNDMKQMVDYSFEALLKRAEPELMNILAAEFLENPSGS